MADKVCKWCSRGFDSDDGSGAGGWWVCSERCRVDLAESIKEGKSQANSGLGATGCVRILVLLAFGAIIIRACASSDPPRSSGRRSQETTEEASSSQESGAVSDFDNKPKPVAADEGGSPAENEPSTETAVEVQPSAAERATEMLRSTEPRYPTRAIMRATGLSRRDIKRLRRELKQEDE